MKIIFFVTHNFNLQCETSLFGWFLQKVVLIKPNSFLQSQYNGRFSNRFKVLWNSFNCSCLWKIGNFLAFWGCWKMSKIHEKNYFHFHFLEKCVAFWVKCDWTFLRFWGVNSTSKEKIWLSWIDFPKTRNENETNFGGSKISNNTCGLWSVQHVRDVMIFT